MKTAHICVLGAAICATAMPAWGFGGEDIARGKPWHHEHITLVALTDRSDVDPADLYHPKVIFTGGAEAIAWHADDIDSYLYNPYFWAKGAVESSVIDRTRAALVGFKDLAKLHFDDTFTNSGLNANFERYAMGTLIGLVWASELPEQDGIAAGHNLLGVSFHAVQDFYSHSSWVSSPQRRCLTFFETPKDAREGMSLFSGAYEAPASGAPAHHGAYSLSCSVFKRDGVDGALESLCGGLSPLQNTSMCNSYRKCSDAGRIDARLGEPLFSGGMLIYTNPPGIALDNTALARAQATNRGLILEDRTFADGADGLHFPRERCRDIIQSEGGTVCDVDADQIFAGTKDLAIRATMEWAEYLEAQMYALGKGAYWERLKSSGSDISQRSAQYEDFSKLPYQFIAAGDYPVSNPVRQAGDGPASARGWFLRLQIRTADTLNAGTNADIFARVKTASGTKDVLLDYLPTDDKKGRVTNRLLVYDDFEAGANDAYMIGPFRDRPVSVALVNKSAGAGEVFDALIEDFSNGIDETLTDARKFLIGFIGGNADFVGSKVKSYTVVSLQQKFAGARAFTDTLDIDGGDEGHHEVVYTVRRTNSGLTQQQREDNWMSVKIEIDKLQTVTESEVDRGSNSDEPFLIFHIAPLNGQSGASHTYMSRPLEDMDSGEEARVQPRRGTKTTVQLPPEGIIVVSAAIYESDDENQHDRNTLKTEFVTGMDEKTQRPAAEFTDALGRAIAEDWEVESLEVYAFHRSDHPLAGPVLAKTRIGEIDGGDVSPDFPFDWGHLTDFSGIKPVLALERPVPDAKTLLQGVWHSDKYQCDGEIPYVEVIIEPKDGDTSNRTDIIATKTRNDGDQCVDEIENGRTFKGRFEDGQLTGERYIVPPPLDRRKEFDPDNPLDRRPDWYDAAIDPNLSLEGNWIIQFGNSSEPVTMAVLSKGGEHGSGSYASGDTYLRFRRDPEAPWAVNFWQPGNVSGESTDSITMSGSAMKVDWGYGMHGHWGGRSTLAAGQTRMTGRWIYGDPDDNPDTGSESWAKAKSAVREIEVLNSEDLQRKQVGDPVLITSEYAGRVYNMRGNRPQFRMRLLGDNLWGRHYFFIPDFTDIEYRRHSYICNGQFSDGSDTHRDWKVCMRETGGVKGIELTLTLWPRAYSGDHILYVDDQEIPFTINIKDEPLRDAEWQAMQMEFLSCNVLQETGRDYYDQPFRLQRADFRPRNARD